MTLRINMTVNLTRVDVEKIITEYIKHAAPGYKVITVTPNIAASSGYRDDGPPVLSGINVQLEPNERGGK